MRTQTQIIAEMRARIGGRRKMMAILDVGQSTVQNWEDEEGTPTVPSGTTVARLALMFPDLAQYCLDQATDGSGNYAKADTATDRLVNIARGHADEVYEAEGVTYRVALSDKASDLQTCDADLTAKLDRALATLD